MSLGRKCGGGGSRQLVVRKRGIGRREGPSAAAFIHLLIAVHSQTVAFHSSGPSRGRSLWKWGSFNM